MKSCEVIQCGLCTTSKKHVPQQEFNIYMDNNGPYAKLFKIINFKGAGGPMFKTCQCAPYIAVMTISKFEPHSRFHS